MEDKWELFYTHTAGGKRDDYSYVDMLSIDMTNKRYILDVHTDGRNTDSEHDEKKHSRTILCLDEFASSCRLRKSDASLVGSIFFYGDFVVCLFGSGNIVSFFYLSLL